MGRATFSFGPGDFFISITCNGAGQIANGLWIQDDTDFTHLTQRDNYNVGEASSGTPSNTWVIHFNLSSGPDTINAYGSCVDPSAFGLAPAGPPTLKAGKVG